MDKKLLTPGPLTTSMTTKEVMLHDWGSRDQAFININNEIRTQLVKMIDGQNKYECIPMQGSGTFAVESMVSSLTSKNSKILILINGAYGHRMNKMCAYLKRETIIYEVPEDQVHDLKEIENIININNDLTHVFVVYCETTSGILNPIQNIANLVAKKNLSLFIDAMSAFGALPISSNNLTFEAVAASSNKCIQGVPGVGFVLCKKQLIENAKGNCHSLSLDLYDQWAAMKKNAQWRFTPPTHVLASFLQALKEHEKEGGSVGRLKRYNHNRKIICDGMKEIGFKQLLSDELQAPIIITFMQPNDANFIFDQFYNKLSEKGFLIYPGKLTVADTFRIGCIGHLDSNDMYATLQAIKETIKELNIKLN